MRSDKSAATEMRRNGLSYKQIHEKLRVPKATLSDWFAHKEWSQKIKTRLDQRMRKEHTVRIIELDRVRGLHLQKVYAEARKEAREDFEILKFDPLFIAGIMLYWGEGDKRNRNQVRLTNTDPSMIALFVTFLLHACKIPEQRISAHLLIYPDNDAGTCKTYWSTTSKIELSKFTKCTLIQGRHKTNRLPYGICMVTVSSTYLKEKMTAWMELLPQELMSKKYYASI